MNKQAGFSLVELMVVIAILAILSAAAIPLYSNYTDRAKIHSALISTNPAKTEIEAALSEGVTPSNLTLPAGVSLSNATPSGATLTLAFNNNYELATGGTTLLRLVAISDENTLTIDWQCQFNNSEIESSTQLPIACDGMTF